MFRWRGWEFGRRRPALGAPGSSAGRRRGASGSGIRSRGQRTRTIRQDVDLDLEFHLIIMTSHDGERDLIWACRSLGHFRLCPNGPLLLPTARCVRLHQRHAAWAILTISASRVLERSLGRIRGRVRTPFTALEDRRSRPAPVVPPVGLQPGFGAVHDRSRPHPAARRTARRHRQQAVQGPARVEFSWAGWTRS